MLLPTGIASEEIEMGQMKRLMRKLRSQTGASLVEYALIASLIALPSVGAMNAIS